ncbi:MAG: hypothetical protein ACYTGN_07440 [Planctomycetota bacterium]|jgi:carbohydrate-selective porin OprB
MRIGRALALAGLLCACGNLPRQAAVPPPGAAPAPPEDAVAEAIAGYLAAEPDGSAANEVFEEGTDGYESGQRLVGGPADVETDLNTSFPKRDAVLPGLIPRGWFAFKEELHDKYGIKLAISYQMLFQQASASLTGTDRAAGGWLLAEFKWEAIDRGGDYEGALVFDIDWRHGLGDSALPGLFGTFGIGSLWPTDLAYAEWDPSLAIFYWDQWFGKGKFNVRIGKQIAAATYDFFRFKDGRTSFSATPFTAHTSIPTPPFGQAVSFKWWPVADSTFYVHGTLNDMNGDPTRVGFDTFFEDHQFFYGLEFGHFWRRGPTEFDHVHLDVFYADEKNSQAPIFPNEAGGGFKVLGSKQMGKVVAFGSYTFNTAQGGGFGVTLAKHTATAGVARLKPLGVRGEVALGLAWMHPINNQLRDQYGGELYWKILLTPDLWVTPGVQLIIDPSFNPAEDYVFIGQFKFRLFF